MNLFRSWKMFLVFSTFRPVQTSRQWFPSSSNFPSWQVRQLRADDLSSLTVQLALLPSAFEQVCTVHYPAVHWLNDDILLGIFNCYRLDEKNRWNRRLGWCKLTHVCQRWRRLIYECSSYLGMHIRYTNGSPMVNTLDHLLLLPLVVSYSLDFFKLVPTVQKQDELGIYHTLQLRDHIRHIHLDLPPPILHKVLMLMDETFPILEHLSLSMFSTASGHLAHRLPLTLPNAFLASNLRHLILFDIGLPKRLRMLASTVSLVTLELRNIQTSSYFRPRLLVARLRSLPLLEKLTIEFFIPIPRPSTERELLGEKRTPVTLPSLKILRFCGVGAYLESLVAQIRVPLLEELKIELFNQIASVLPHLFDLINITEVFKLGRAIIGFYPHEVSVAINVSPGATPFDLCVRCMPLGWQFDSAAQICDALVPTLSSAEELSLVFDCHQESSTEMQNGAIDSASWHNLLRGFIGVKTLDIDDTLTEELSRVLQVDEVGSDSGFLPNLQSIHAEDNRFASFIDTRQAVGRPVEFFQLEVAPRSLPSSRPSSVVVSL